MPATVFKILLGEQSQLILNGQLVQPAALLQQGFQFKFPTLKRSLTGFIGLIEIGLLTISRRLIMHLETGESDHSGSALNEGVSPVISSANN